jgi:hypothetical protein
MQSSIGRELIRFALAFICLCGGVQAEPALRLEGATRWQLDAPWFGGWSGIEIGAEGRQMTVISDKGQLVVAAVQRVNGRITGIAVQSAKPMGNPAGKQLRNKGTDAEGLAIGNDGTAYVSFEHRHRIMQIDLSNGRTFGKIDVPFKKLLGSNAGVEALAVGPDGIVYAIPEHSPDGRVFPVYAYVNERWQITARIPQRGPFVPVGADFDPYGRLWLLERAVTPLGFRSRIRLFVLDAQAPQEYTLLTTLPAIYDNLEGLSVWPDARGQLHVTMISDDNFLRVLRTQIVEYSVWE